MRTMEALSFTFHADYIISGDTRHLQPIKEFQNIPILSPAKFLALISR